ncbi:hypothetical protein ACSHWB_06860 [Lentzea sp. HUAS TT2]|uniref:hypothetical protein n=1 Tax=Lentzea sp. HUAS TT2 TaxID=3447454 RepID=UPI003F6EBBA8
MAGAVGIVFGLCVLSFTLGAALMYVLVRRREDAATPEPATAQAPDERTWVNKPAAVEPVDADYDSRPIHRNPVMGLRQMEPALAALAEPVGMRKPVEAVGTRKPVEPVAEPRPAEPVAGRTAAPVVEREPAEPVAEPKTVGAAGYDWDGDLVPPVGNFEAPESTVAPSTDSPAVPASAESSDSVESPDALEVAENSIPEPVEEPEPEPAPPVVRTALPPPASPQPVEHTTWVEREDFRQRYLRTFEEVRRKAGSN